MHNNYKILKRLFKRIRAKKKRGREKRDKEKERRRKERGCKEGEGEDGAKREREPGFELTILEAQTVNQVQPSDLATTVFQRYVL